MVYITILIPYLNQNIKSFTIETLVYLVEIRLECLDISWGCTETFGCVKFFKKLYFLLNLSVLILITNSPKQLGTFVTISRGKGAIYFSMFSFLVLYFFACQIVILQEWTKFITIRWWTSSALRKQYMILIIRDCYQTYCHQPIYGTSGMTKVMKKNKYQMIVLCIKKIFFCHIKIVEWKGETYQYWLFCGWLDVTCDSSH